jgi:transposase
VAKREDMTEKICARKRHVLVDTEGLVLKAKVHSAKVPEQDGLKMMLVAGVDKRAGVWQLKDTCG